MSLVTFIRRLAVGAALGAAGPAPLRLLLRAVRRRRGGRGRGSRRAAVILPPDSRERTWNATKTDDFTSGHFLLCMFSFAAAELVRRQFIEPSGFQRSPGRQEVAIADVIDTEDSGGKGGELKMGSSSAFRPQSSNP